MYFYSGGTFLGAGISMGGGNNYALALPATSNLLPLPGNWTITAAYLPSGGQSADYQGTTSTGATLQVKAPSTTTTLADNPPGFVYGQQVTLSGSVYVPVGSTQIPVPGATVTFTDNGNSSSLAPPPTSSGGTYSVATRSLTVGSHSFVASFAGLSPLYPGSQSNPAGLSVQVDQAQTLTTVTPNISDDPVAGATVTFTAKLSALSPGGGVPDGTVTFTNTLTNTTYPASLSAGAATWGPFGAGSYAITATYSGSSNYLTSTASPLGLNLQPAPTLQLSTLASGGSTGNPLQNLAGLATVFNSPGTATLTLNNGAAMAVPLAADGSFSYPVLLQNGANTVTVTVTDALGMSASSPAITLTLDPSLPDLSITSPGDNLVSQAQVPFTVSQSLVGSSQTVTSLSYSVNGVAGGTLAAGSGDFQFTPALTPGLNTVELSATTSGGQTVTAKRSITLSPAAAVAVAINSPGADLLTDQTSLPLAGSISPAPAPPASISFSLDGTAFSLPVAGDGSFSGSTPAFAIAAGNSSQLHSLTQVGSDGSIQTLRNILQVPVPVSAITTSPSAPTYGQQVTFSVQVPDGYTGSVTFSDGGTALGPVTMTNSGGATYATVTSTSAGLATGLHSITAQMTADAYFPPATARLALTVAQANPPTPTVSTDQSLISWNEPGPYSLFGQLVTFTASIPTGYLGTVTFLYVPSSGTPLTLGTASADGSDPVTCTTTLLPAGTDSVQVNYGADLNYLATSFILDCIVAQASAAIVLGNQTAVFDGSPKQLTVTTVPAGVSTQTTYSQNGMTAIPIAVGTYTASVLVIDPNYQGSATGTLMIYPDTPPTLQLSSLASGDSTADPLQNLAGVATVFNNPGSVTLILNPGTATAVTASVPVAADGSFSYPLQLQNGSNTITATVTDVAGLSDSKNVTLTLDPSRPDLNISSPGDNLITQVPVPFTVSQSLLGSSQTVTSLSYSVNGAPGGTLQAAAGSADFQFTPTLVDGLNTVELSATPSGGGPAVTAKRSITLTQAPAAAFSVAFSSPGADLLTDQTSLPVVASISPALVPPASVSFSLDGTPFSLSLQPDGSYSGSTPAFAINPGNASQLHSLTLLASDGLGNSVQTVRNILQVPAPVNTLTASTLPPGSGQPVTSSSSVFGQAVTFSVPVPAGYSGSVSFSDGGTLLGTGTLDSLGNANFTTASALATGSHAITAQFAADPSFSLAPVTLTLTVASATPFSLAAPTLTSSPATPTFGLPATLSVPVPAGYLGTVTFSCGGVTLGTATADGSDPVTCATSLLPAGSDSITVAYGADLNYNAASFPLAQSVLQAPASVSLSGLAAFYDGTAKAATATTTPSGLSTQLSYSQNGISVVPIALGTYAVLATVSDPDYQGSASGSLTISASTPPTLQLSSLASGDAMGDPLQNIAGLAAASSGGAITLSLTLNGAAPVTVPLATDGSFSYPVQLQNGANAINIAVNETAGLVLSQSFTLNLDPSLPSLAISSPADNQVIQGNVPFTVSQSLLGSSQTVTALAYIVNGVQIATLPAGSGDFQFTPALTAGLNTVELIASTSGGQSAKAKCSLTLNPAAAFAVAFSSPGADLLTDQTSLPVVASISPAPAPPASVSFSLDGTPFSLSLQPDGSYTGSTPAFAINPGNTSQLHSLTLLASDGLGHSVQTVRNILQVPAQVNTLTASTLPPGSGQPVTTLSSVFGQAVTFSVPVPDGYLGTVSFQDNGNGLGAGIPDGLGNLTFTTSALGCGNHSITAQFTADTNYPAATSSLALSVAKASTSTTLAPVSGNLAYGQSVTLAATVAVTAPGAGVPTGMVNFSDNGVLLGSGSLDTTGRVSLTTTALVAGSYPVSASYQGDGNDLASVSAALSPSVSQAMPSVTWQAPAPMAAGTALTSAQLNASANVPGLFSYTPAAGTVMAAGLGQVLKVSFTPMDALDYAAVTQTVSVDVSPAPAAAPPTLKLSSLAGGRTTGNPLQNFAGVVTVANGPASVTLTLNGAAPVAVTLADGSFSYPVQLQNGSNTITVTVTDAAGLSVSQSIALTLDPSLPELNLSSPGDNLVTQTNNVSFTGSLNLNGSSQAITALFYKINNLGVYGVPLPALGSDFQFTPSLDPGLNTVELYGTFAGGQTVTAKRSITLSPAAAYSVAINSPGEDLLTDQTSLPLAGSISPAPALPGSATFSLDGIPFSLTVASDGSFSGATPTFTIPAGNPSQLHSLTLVASDGNGNSVQSVRNFIQVPAPVTTLTASVSGSGSGQPVTSSSTVFGQPVTFTLPVPAGYSGSVSFWDGGTLLGTVTPDSFGNATFSTTSALATGSHTITAQFAADPSFPLAPVSLALTVTPVPPVPATPPTPTLSTSQTSSGFGQSVTFTASIPPGYRGTVTFTCGGITLGTAIADGSDPVTCSTSLLPAGSDSVQVAYGADPNYAAASFNLPQSESVSQAVPTLTWPHPAAMAAGTALGSAQLNASANVPGLFNYSPAAGTILAAGLGQTLTVTFTPADSLDYTAVSSTVSVDVSAAPASAPPSLKVSTLADGAVTAGFLLNVAGQVTSGNGMQSLTINGATVPLGADGSFSCALRLAAGVNAITTLATDNQGLSSSDLRSITLDTSAPSLVITAPADNLLTSAASAAFTGTLEGDPAQGGAAAVSYSVNDGPVQQAVLSGSLFQFSPQLAPGLNTVTITGVTSSGAQVMAKRSLTQGPGFSLAITDPGQDLLTDQASYALAGTVTGNLTPVTVTVTLDGQVWTPAVVQGAFQQLLSFPLNQPYTVTVTAVDQAQTSLAVTRNYFKVATLAPALYTMADALRALLIADGLIIPTAEDLARYDLAPLINGVPSKDGVITVDDALIVLDLASGLDL